MNTKAPIGGTVSKVNGQFYEGGEFIPEHGLFCGKKGIARKNKTEKQAARGRYIDCNGSKLFEVFERVACFVHPRYRSDRYRKGSD